MKYYDNDIDVFSDPILSEDFTLDEIVLDVDDYEEESSWARLLHNLAGNETLVNVKICRGSQPTRSYKDLVELFETLSNISSIQQIEFNFMYSDDLEATRPLLETPKLSQQQQQQSHRKLQELRFRRVCTCTEIIPLDFLQSLARLPIQPNLQIHNNLTTLYLSDLNLFEWESRDIECRLSAICQSSTLQDITIYGYGHPREQVDGDMRSLFHALQQNTVLRAFCSNLQFNRSSVPFLADMLRYNTTLQRLSLSIFPNEQDCQIILKKGCMKNKTLLSFINNNDSCIEVSKETEGLQLEFLRQNWQLEEFALFREDTPYEDAKQMYLDLNMAGRKRLFGIVDDDKSLRTTSTLTPTTPPKDHGNENYDNNPIAYTNNRSLTVSSFSNPNRIMMTTSVADQGWVEFMSENCDNLDFLYYGLSLRPSLCRAS